MTAAGRCCPTARAYGVDAYLYCDHLRTLHNHHCVLDRFCLPPGVDTGNLTTHDSHFGTPIYWMSLVQVGQWGLRGLGVECDS